MWWGLTISLKLSIIIPTFNEAPVIVSSLTALQSFRSQGHELILVDGGSDDNTKELARPSVDQLIDSNKGRALQMNAGAQQASGNMLLFLHSDTQLPIDALDKLIDLSANEDVWGRFDVQLSNDALVYKVIAFFMNLRSRVTSIATGDQAIFISRKLFFKVNGYPSIAIMEDVAICKHLKKIVSPICLRSKIITSARRWEKSGVMKTILTMWVLRLAFFCKVSPKRLAKIYE